MGTRQFMIILFIFCFHIQPNLKCQWYKSDLGGNLNRAIFLNQTTGILTGDQGKIYLTNDQGITWEDKSLAVSKRISGGQFINDSTIYIVSYDTIENFWISTNCGDYWEAKSFYKEDIYNAYFINDSTGIFVVKNHIIKINLLTNIIDTLWSTTSEDSVKYCFFKAVSFVDDSTGFAHGVKFKIVNDLIKLYGIILRTDDQGKTWKYIYDSDSLLFMGNSGLFIANNRLYVYDESLFILYTDISLKEPIWNILRVPYSVANIESNGINSITSIFYTSIDTGYITISPTLILWPPEGKGYDMILKTCDGGTFWFRQLVDTFNLETTYATPSLSSIFFVNDSVSIACGYNKIFRTTNSGDGVISDFKENSDNNNNIKIWQNRNQLIIEFGYTINKLTVNIFDLGGKLIQQINESNSTISNFVVDVKLFNEGIYFINVIVDGKYKITKKFLFYSP
ncbi:MAG: T9SS type A sorting domain-containing protein [Bacteroidales bacterium]|nr:T9SS type A sorting domain-containing protein [Bacteroidales bacterium]